METETKLCDRNFREILVSGKDVTDDDLRECVEVFNSSYGTWSEQVTLAKPRLKAGQYVFILYLLERYNSIWILEKGAPIMMSFQLLRKQCLFDPENCYLSRVFSGSDLCGYAFAGIYLCHSYSTFLFHN